ncbi:MAG: PEGA domain-containing protein, partial [Thermococci archaeon]|nr:PEGA domain-containing protein [Thermococci archaeon]
MRKLLITVLVAVLLLGVVVQPWLVSGSMNSIEITSQSMYWVKLYCAHGESVVATTQWNSKSTGQINDSVISVYSKPSGAKLYLNGAYIGTTPMTLTVQPGVYNMTLLLSGYKPYSKLLVVYTRETLKVLVNLTPLPVNLTITSDPYGAKVYINGTYKGITPLVLSLIPGTYKVKLTRRGYKNYTTTVKLSPDKSKTLSVTLSPLYGQVKITSTPLGAKVYINGSYKGMTPLDLSLPPGTYNVRISKQGYKDYETPLSLSAGEHKTLSVTLTPLFGYLTVTSTPSGASVYIDGKYAGTTPLENYRLPTGDHTVKVGKDGYKTYTTTVDVSPGATSTVSATLHPLPVKVSITSTPPGASVYINGVYKGTTPLTLSLAPRTYDVKVVKNGYKTWEKSVTVEAGSPVSLAVSLT